jgi:predicted dehydrogenase
MWNATHAIAPTLALGGNEAESVSCFGSGTIDERMHAKYGSPFAIETVHIKFRNSDLVAEVTRSLFNTARQYRESFDVYGSKKSFEWTQIEGEKHIIHTGERPERVEVPDFAHLLPKEIQSFTRAGVYNSKDKKHLSSALREGREPLPNARQAANITCSGILAHESALKGGAAIRLPEWTLSPPA